MKLTLGYWMNLCMTFLSDGAVVLPVLNSEMVKVVHKLGKNGF